MRNSSSAVGLVAMLATACGGAARQHRPTVTAVDPVELRADGAAGSSGGAAVALAGSDSAAHTLAAGPSADRDRDSHAGTHVVHARSGGARVALVGAPVALAAGRAIVVLAALVDRAGSSPSARDRVGARLSRALEDTGFEVGALSQLEPGREAFVVSPTIERIAIARDRARIQIDCRVRLRIAPWRDGERWEPGRMASATSSARAVTGPRARDLAPATADCLDAAIDALTDRHVVPFLMTASAR